MATPRRRGSAPRSPRSASDGSGTAVTANRWTRGDGSGVTRSARRTHPRSPRSHQVRWAGDSETSGRVASGRNGPRSAATFSTAARRSSRGSSRSMFIANAASATASSQATSRPSIAGRNARTSVPGLHASAGHGVREHEHPELLVHDRAARRVAQVAEADQPDAGRGVPGHVRPEPRIPAGVLDDRPQLGVGHDDEPEAVAPDHRDRRLVGRARRQVRRDRSLDLLHLPARRPAQRVVALGVVPGGKRVHEPRHPAGEVADGREHAAHRRQRPVRVVALAGELVVPAHVAAREALGGHVLGQVGGRRHAQRDEDPVAHELAVLDAGHRRDHAAEDPVAEVRVLEDRARRPRERRARGEEPLEGVERQALLPVAPWIVRGEAGRHRHQLADRDRRGVGRGRAPAGERRDVVGDRVVQAEAAFVAEHEQRRGREALGHRRDAVDRVRVGAPILAVADRAGAGGMDQGAVADHAPGDAGDPGLLAEALEARVERGQQVVERRHATIMPDGAPCRGAASARRQAGASSTNTRNASTSRKPIAS